MSLLTLLFFVDCTMWSFCLPCSISPLQMLPLRSDEACKLASVSRPIKAMLLMQIQVMTLNYLLFFTNSTVFIIKVFLVNVSMMPIRLYKLSSSFWREKKTLSPPDAFDVSNLLGTSNARTFWHPNHPPIRWRCIKTSTIYLAKGIDKLGGSIREICAPNVPTEEQTRSRPIIGRICTSYIEKVLIRNTFRSGLPSAILMVNCISIYRLTLGCCFS